MNNESKSGKSKGSSIQQPEAEASLESAARSGSKKPRDQGLKARGDTAPQPGSPEKGQARAADILGDNARKDAGGNPRGK